MPESKQGTDHGVATTSRCVECTESIRQISVMITGQMKKKNPTRQEIVDAIPVTGFADVGEGRFAPVQMYTPHRWSCIKGRKRADPSS